MVEIWDVRRGWITKWAVCGSVVKDGVSGEASHYDLGLWTKQLVLVLL